MNKEQLFRKVTQQFLDLLNDPDAERATWQRPWNALMIAPTNPQTGTVYRGFNQIACITDMLTNGYERPLYVTYQGAKKLGGYVAESGGITLIAPNFKYESEREARGNGHDKPHVKYVYWKQFTVFNIALTEGIDESKLPQVEANPDALEPNDRADALIDSYFSMDNAPLLRNEMLAAYNWTSDIVLMPPRQNFHSAGDYYATLFHEVIHSTGAENCTNRCNGNFGLYVRTDYAGEELIAELGSAILRAYTGVDAPELDDNTASYLQAWYETLNDDPSILVDAASAAQDAA